MKLSKAVFEVDQVLKGIIPVGDDQCRFDYQKLESAIKAVVKKKLQDENATMMDTSQGHKVPTFVVATKGLHAEGPPTLFRSYQCSSHNASKCAIWEAGRATSSAPTFFKPIKIQDPLPGATFVDGALVHNNPAELALSEAQKIWTTVKRFSLVSVGTGQLKSVRVVQMQSDPPKGSRLSTFVGTIARATSLGRVPQGMATLKRIAEACVDLTTDSERVHQRLLNLSISIDPNKQFPYHRFNVDRNMQDIGLEGWGKIEEMTVHTAAYMERGEGEIKRNNCVHDLMNPLPIESKFIISHLVDSCSYQTTFVPTSETHYNALPQESTFHRAR